MTVPQDKMTIETAALDWIIRQRHPDFDDWDGFTAWLEADPTHADIYQAMAVADEDMAALTAQIAPASPVLPIPANDAPSPRFQMGRRRWIGGVLAACVAGAIGMGVLMSRSDPWAIETRPGERREIALADGTHIILNGGTRLLLDRKAPRKAVMERGEALFVVTHDDNDPFEVHAGPARLVDVGTAFNVVRDGPRLDVAVSEGAVVYNPGAEAARIDAGHRLHVVDGEGRYAVTPVVPAQVAGWRSGRLFYDGQSLSTVAADIGRYYGLSTSVAPSIGARPFRGLLTLPRQADPATLGPLLDARIEIAGQSWTFSPRP